MVDITIYLKRDEKGWDAHVTRTDDGATIGSVFSDRGAWDAIDWSYDMATVFEEWGETL